MCHNKLVNNVCVFLYCSLVTMEYKAVKAVFPAAAANQAQCQTHVILRGGASVWRAWPGTNVTDVTGVTMTTGTDSALVRHVL